MISSTGSYIICVGIFRVSGSFESIICTNGSVRFTCTDWGICVWTGYGVTIELIKNILQLLSTSTGGIGELANFLMGASYVLVAGFIYKYKKTKKMAMWACVISSVVMGIAAAIVNYFILLPLFETFMPLEQLIESFGEFLPFIKTKLDVVLFNALPFNILKGLVIGAITMMIYKKLTPILKGENLK